MQCTGNSGCFPLEKRAAIVRRYSAFVFSLCVRCFLSIFTPPTVRVYIFKRYCVLCTVSNSNVRLSKIEVFFFTMPPAMAHCEVEVSAAKIEITTLRPIAVSYYDDLSTFCLAFPLSIVY